MTDAEKAAADAKAAQAEEIKAIVAEALKPVTSSITSLTTTQADIVKNQSVIADTLKNLPPATPEKKPGEKKDGEPAVGDAPKPLTAEEVAKLVADGIAAANKAQQTTAQQQAARDAFVKDEKNGIAKLPPLYQNQLGGDPAKWPDEAKALATQWESDFKGGGGKVADVGGAAREGGNLPAGGDGGKPRFDNLTEGERKFADGIKLPGAA